MSTLGLNKKLKPVRWDMMKKQFNPNLTKIHRSYTVEEIAGLYGIHKNTVRAWIKDGLPSCDNKRPMLFLGRELRAFLQSKRVKNKRTCLAYEMYCLKCRSPRRPADGEASFVLMSDSTGRVFGKCPQCCGQINKYINIASLEHLKQDLIITIKRL
jgi:hypothetical protein